MPLYNKPKSTDIPFSFAWIILTAGLSYIISVSLSAQELAPTEVQDYFDTPHAQSYHRQKVITTMKKEVNSYSERLHDLQQRFYQIFYGQGEGDPFAAPFQQTSVPPLPSTSKPAEKGIYVPPKETEIEGIQSGKLAFEVDVSQGKNSVKQNETKERFLGSGKGYWVIRSGFAYPHEPQRGSFGGAEKYRKYKTGFLINAAGGYVINQVRIGLGVYYRRNSFHSSSYEGNPVQGFESGKGASTFAAYLDLGFDYPISDSFDFLVSLGLGYGVTVIEDSLSGNARYDPTFLLTPGVGGRWNFSTNYAFEFGYRYVREDEVPAHAFELGLSGKI